MLLATLSQEPQPEVLPCPVSCLSDDTVLSFVLPCRMNGPGEEKRNLRPLTLVLSRLLITGIGPGIWWVLKELNLTANHPTYYGNGFTVRCSTRHSCKTPIIWNEGSDLNRWLYSFADCSFGPLRHPHLIMVHQRGFEPRTNRLSVCCSTD